MSRFGSQFKQRKPKMKRIQNISLSLMSLLSECGGHQGTPRTLILALLLLLALTSCQKRPQPSTPEDQKTLIGFSAVSQSVAVKSETTPKTTFPYTNFGVWGIARCASVESPYILWTNNQLTEVSTPEGTQTNQQVSNVVFTPSSDAYWLRDYTYNFLAVAPYDDEGFELTAITQSTSDDVKDQLTFLYDVSYRYELGNYTFDLLGATAEQPVTTGGYNQTQPLIFWHLFSQIEIENIGFATGINGTVTKILMKSYPSAEYTIEYDESIEDSTKPTKINCDAITENSDGTSADKAEISFKNPAFGTANPIVNIIPQLVSGLELYIDFTINEGTDSAPVNVQYTDFKINLNVSGNPTEYVPNGKYNWTITIGAKNAISFKVVTVTPWKEDTPKIDEIPLT